VVIVLAIAVLLAIILVLLKKEFGKASRQIYKTSVMSAEQIQVWQQAVDKTRTP